MKGHEKTRPENYVFSCAILFEVNWPFRKMWWCKDTLGIAGANSKEKIRQWTNLLSALLDAACFSTARILADSKIEVSSAIWSLILSLSPTLDMLSSSKASGKSLLVYLIIKQVKLRLTMTSRRKKRNLELKNSRGLSRATLSGKSSNINACLKVVCSPLL